MRPADELAAYMAIAHAVDHRISELKQTVAESMDDTGADRYRTPLGAVYLIKARQWVVIPDDQRLVEFAEQNDPEAVIKTVRPSFRDQFIAIGDSVIYNPTGEVIDFAYIRRGTTSIGVRLLDEAKQRALEVLRESTDPEAVLVADRLVELEQ